MQWRCWHGDGVGNRASDVFSDQPHADSGYRRADSARTEHSPAALRTTDSTAYIAGELERLQYRVRHGAPWYQRFGLERNTQLLDAAFPGYAQAASRLVRDVAATHLQNRMRLSPCLLTALSVRQQVSSDINSLKRC
jgi:hypothetical protein